MIISNPEQFNVPDLFIDASAVVGGRALLKCEGMNFAGSIKLKTAVGLVEHGERLGIVTPGATIVESSSGNLGIALSIVAASRGYRFHCVTDTRCNEATVRLMRAYGAEVEVVTTPDVVTGFLGARLARVRQIVATSPDAVWLNQYENPANPAVHADTTAEEILGAFDHVDVLFLGVGTAGTAMGCARRFRELSPSTRIIGVDAVGSVSFGGAASPRHIPGLGAGVVPPQLDLGMFDELVEVPEEHTIEVCRAMLDAGFLLGGSSGTVLAAAKGWYRANPSDREATMVAIGPDLGERYLESIYDQRWVDERFPQRVAGPLDAMWNPEPKETLV